MSYNNININENKILKNKIKSVKDYRKGKKNIYKIFLKLHLKKKVSLQVVVKDNHSTTI